MISTTHRTRIRTSIATVAIVTGMGVAAGPAAAQTGTPPNCDQSFNQPAPGTGPEWQANGTDPNFNGPAPGTGPEWQTDQHGPEWYSGVPCSNAAPQPTPVQETVLSRTIAGLGGLLGGRR